MMSRKSFSPMLFLALLLLVLLLSGSAALGIPANASSIPAAMVLNADGTLNPGAGVSGALDLAGWDVNLDPQRGPVLKPEVNGTWSGLGNGLSSAVNAIAVSGTDVYVGGVFTQVCGNAACDSGNSAINRIARWSSVTHTWSALQYGVSGGVAAIAVSGGDVYAGGFFKQVCGNGACDSGNTTVNAIAKWSSATNSWSPVGNGVDHNVDALAVNGSDVYAGGDFHQVCGNVTCDSGNTTVNRIAKWSTKTNRWAALGNGLSDLVSVLAVNGSDVYAGGFFTETCGNTACDSGNVTVNQIAKWSTKTNRWSALGNGLSDWVSTVAVYGSDVYVGGNYGNVCGNAACDSGNTRVNHIAKWSTATNSWSGLANGVNHLVTSVVVRDGSIYLGGRFSQTCIDLACSNSPDTTVNRLVKWSPVTDSWARLGYGVREDDTGSYPRALAVNGNEVYVGGLVSQTCGNSTCDSGNTTVSNIAKFAIAACAAPAQPVMLAPVKNGTTNKTRPLLQWANPGCVQTYDVTIKDAGTGAVIDSKTGLTNYQVKTPKLTHGKTYKWFVKGCVGATCVKSKTWKFTVK